MNTTNKLFSIFVMLALLLAGLPGIPVEAAATNPTPLMGEVPPKSISAGSNHTCALATNGTLICWGDNSFGQTDVPTLADNLNYTLVSAGTDHTCGLVSDGTLKCWGSNLNDQTDVPTLADTLSYTGVAAGHHHTCGLVSDGSLQCWGDNSNNQTDVDDTLTYAAVATGEWHTCGLISDGSLKCWGLNDDGQTDVPTLPVGQSYIGVSAGLYHTCGLISDGSLDCWGSDTEGKTDVPPLPVGESYIGFDTGRYYTCGLVSNGSLTCWGLSADNDGEKIVPALPDGLSYTAVSAGFYHTCGLVSNGSLNCWGRNNFGQTDVPPEYTVIKKIYKSIGLKDGWVLESGEFTNKGGSLNVGATTLLLGDNNLKKQYRSILSFSTKGLPDNAVITKVTLMVKKRGIVGGGNPVNIFQGFKVDIKKGTFGKALLQTSDFQTRASRSYGPFKPALKNGWYSFNLTTGKNFINKLTTAGGLTQIRLRFKLGDNNNALNNYLSLYSGNAPLASRPKLIVEYYVP